MAYTTQRFADPYHPKNAVTAGEDPIYHLMVRTYATGQVKEPEFDAYLAAVSIPGGSSVAYALLGHGPDLDHDDPAAGTVAAYDPTNGTVSNGDILYFGPGLGFGDRK